ncbi:hypothetical protein Nmul_A1565 [Nitrosospira multiformis ATCC 25196]|uniref:Transposase IS4-like domain-containing protein n=1 Tax=Nitrosospira multiformis (strain ATCC 25196 / NCIMB 11849 / C 71) TaxID=323848 RepID=Q2Y8Q3_NITMU|nr:hypothetical protein Nmul_A1565 [Nitrosospira multiformis ATCC 25196]
MNSKLHAVCDGRGKPVALLLSEGQMSDYKGGPCCCLPCPGQKSCWGIAAMMLTGSGQPSDKRVLRRNGISLHPPRSQGYYCPVAKYSSRSRSP